MNIMELIKVTLDPGHIMNPGKVLWMDDIYADKKKKKKKNEGDHDGDYDGDGNGLRPKRSESSEYSTLRKSAFNQRTDHSRHTHDRYVPNCLSDSGPIVPIPVSKKK